MKSICYSSKMTFVTNCLKALLLILSFVSSAGAEVYRWVDSAGKTHYGDRAPQEPRAKAERMTVNTGPQGVDPDAERNRQQMRTIDEGRQREKAFAEQRAAADQQRKADLAQRCKSLQNDIRQDQEVAMFYRYDDKGNRVMWSSEERLAYREKLQTLKQTYCSDY
ncbi:MAG: DUF4124 domain-containing protein [Spongiibacteraceae bacterium]